ncbi:MAG: ATP-binding protein [Prevotella sp.]|nr:ATP-binding protein [Prevotella sp.]
MQFFDRKYELEKLRKIKDRSEHVAQFTVITGRRRIGKTCLIKKAYEDTPYVYLFVARKTESELCETFKESTAQILELPIIGRVNKFSDIFKLLLETATRQPLTVVIDEFQEFYKVNPAIFSEMQNLWDSYKDRARINLVVCGSVNSLLNKIFRDKKEPLYGRQTDMMRIRAFAPSVMKEIMAVYSPDYTSEDLLAMYLFTGGVAKYIEMFVDRGCMTKERMLDVIFEPDGFFMGEGKAMLIEEFGKDYGTYFSILSLIAQGHTTRGDVENILGIEIGGYMKKLIEDYELIVKRQPLFEKSQNKNVHYALDDNFLRFWFRFIFRYSYMIESGAHQQLRLIVERDYNAYSGRVLEDYFREKFKEMGSFTRLGYWHGRNGENDIDIIAADELKKTVTFNEVKRQTKDLDMHLLKDRADIFLKSTREFKNFDISYNGLSMENM